MLALWLTRLGVGVRIVDKSAEPGTTSRALGVQARTLELYRQVGLADDVVDGGVQVPGLNFWVRGAHAARMPFGQLGEGLTPFSYPLMYPQDAHERLLIDRLASSRSARGAPHRAGRASNNTRPRARDTRAADGSEEICEVAFVAGCDGAHSIVRHTLGVGFPGGTYSGIFYVADVDASGPPMNGDCTSILTKPIYWLFSREGRAACAVARHRARTRPEQLAQLTFDDVSQRAIEHLRLTSAR